MYISVKDYAIFEWSNFLCYICGVRKTITPITNKKNFTSWKKK